MNVAVVSAVYGGFDDPSPPPPQSCGAEWVMVSDRDWNCPPWRVVTEPRPLVHPRLAAKVPKARPDLYAPDADVCIWVDANMRISDPGFVSWCVASLGGADLALTPHPQAGTLAGEAALAAPLAKYAGLPMAAQVRHYLDQGFPDGCGHWWAGLIVRRRTCPDFGSAWLAEMLRWGYEDQISLPYVLWQAGICPAGLPPGWAQGRFGWAAHGPEPQFAPVSPGG